MQELILPGPSALILDRTCECGLFLLLPEDYSISVTIKYGTAWKQDFLLPQAEKPLRHNKTCL